MITFKVLFFTDKVSDMIDKLYPTKINVQHKELTTHLRETFNTVSELECGAHATLAAGPMDYWTYIDGKCYLGNIPDGSTSSGETTTHDVYILKSKCLNSIKEMMDNINLFF